MYKTSLLYSNIMDTLGLLTIQFKASFYFIASFESAVLTFFSVLHRLEGWPCVMLLMGYYLGFYIGSPEVTSQRSRRDDCCYGRVQHRCEVSVAKEV